MKRILHWFASLLVFGLCLCPAACKTSQANRIEPATTADTRPAAAPSDIFIEAESCPCDTFDGPASFPGIVSGDRILSLWKNDDPPAEGYFAKFPFSVAKGNYHIWLAASLPEETSNFWFRVDDQPWNHITVDSFDEFPTTFGVSDVMGWIQLTQSPLENGPHTLSIKVNERRKEDEHAYLLYLDAILITPRDVKPAGLTTPADLKNLKPLPPPVEAVKRASDRVGEPMLLGTSVDDARANSLLHRLGFTLAQTDSDHLLVNGPSPGTWDWTDADAGNLLCKNAGMAWQYFPHDHWPPKWYHDSDRFVPTVGLRTGRVLGCISPWSPDLPKWVDDCYAALANQYHDSLGAIYLGIHGDFGEPIMPMGWNKEEAARFGPEHAGTSDFWCGDTAAKQDFRTFFADRYRDIQTLNNAWGTTFDSFDHIDYPPLASQAIEGLQETVATTPQQRRRWLDFINWYDSGMTRLTQQVCSIARKHFPKTTLVLPFGGGSEDLCYAQDISALAKVAAQYGVQVRSTHGGFKPFAENYPQMLKRVASAAKFYHDPLWLEPPGKISPDRQVSRFMEALSCGCWGYWDWADNPTAWPDVYRQYRGFLTRESPVVDVALLFPTTSHRLQMKDRYPPLLAKIGAELRDVMDFDVLDEELVADGAADGYRVIIWTDGNIIEAPVLEKLRCWVENGGVLLRLGAGPVTTVEGDRSAVDALVGTSPSTVVSHPQPKDAASVHLLNAPFLRYAATADFTTVSAATTLAADAQPLITIGPAGPTAPAVMWAVHHGRGWVVEWAGVDPSNPRAFEQCARDVVYHLSALDKTKNDATEVDTQFDGVYSTLLRTGEVILLNPGQQSRTVNIGSNVKLTLPPASLRSVMFSQ